MDEATSPRRSGLVAASTTTLPTPESTRPNANNDSPHRKRFARVRLCRKRFARVRLCVGCSSDLG